MRWRCRCGCDIPGLAFGNGVLGFLESWSFGNLQLGRLELGRLEMEVWESGTGFLVSGSSLMEVIFSITPYCTMPSNAALQLYCLL
jgi:hypothetical protein